MFQFQDSVVGALSEVCCGSIKGSKKLRYFKGTCCDGSQGKFLIKSNLLKCFILGNFTSVHSVTVHVKLLGGKDPSDT